MELCTKLLFFITICRLKSIDCQITCDPNNNFINNPLALTYMNGVYYRVYTTAPYFGNQIFKYKTDTANKAIYAHTYDDAACCKTINMSTVVQNGGYYIGRVYSDSGCITPEEVQMKLLLTNGSQLGGLLGGLLNALLLDNLCIVMWVCRASLEGVHVLCRKPTVSLSTFNWIQTISSSLNITLVSAVNNQSYLNTPCISDF